MIQQPNSLHVLIVDDSANMRRMITSLVKPFAAAVVECSDSKEALSIYEMHRPDLVLMDIQLEGIDGIDGIVLTRRICAEDPLAQVVMVTSYDDADLRSAAAGAGACGYILKENLLELQEVLSRQSSRSRIHVACG